MAGHLNRWLALSVWWLAGAAVAVAPEILQDPTRPPASFAGEPGAVAEISGSRLSSVFLPKQGKPSAIIGGQVIPLGGMVGEARLIKVTETGAVLEGPEGIEQLYLTPDVEKKTRVTKGASRRPKDKP
jgi:MSHA biogenesis protein MshK